MYNKKCKLLYFFVCEIFKGRMLLVVIKVNYITLEHFCLFAPFVGFLGTPAEADRKEMLQYSNNNKVKKIVK